MTRILIIGLGSIGLKHYKILKKINKKFEIKVLSKNKIKNINYIEKKNVLKFNPSYIIISNHTSKHVEYLNFINDHFKKVKILVEKPLFHKPIKFKIKNNNKIFVGYNLRYHPVVDKLKKLIKKNKFYYSSLTCFSFLPNWRSNIHYKLSNSAQEKYGGGVLAELSHEIDLIDYLFEIKKVHSSFNSKISQLEINTDDFLNLNTFCNKVKFCNLSVNFFDNLRERKIRIVGKDYSYEADILNNLIKVHSNKNFITKKIKIKAINTYEKLHKSILNSEYKNICNFKQGKKILKIINEIKKNG